MHTNVWCMPAHRLMIQPPRRGYWTVTLNRHDLQPRANTSGQLTWWGWVRGRPVLMGVVMPVRLFSNVERAA